MAADLWHAEKLIRSNSSSYLSLQSQVAMPLAAFLRIARVSLGDSTQSSILKSRSGIAAAHSAASHIFSLRNRRFAVDTNHSDAKYTPLTISSLEFRDVSFAYSNRHQSSVLQHLNFRVNRGQNIAIVGASGSGKSTVTALLERFYDVDSGSILVNGNPIQSLNLGQYRTMISLVSQDTVLYRGTIEENVLLGVDENSPVSHNDVIQACQDANIHDFILTLPQGYNTACGIRGLSLSGGQRQRLAIARALVRNTPVLLLDEATSALDTESEQLVQDALRKAMEGRLTITIAHRLSTIRNADCIYVLSKGRFHEWGSHDVLLQKRGLYYTMCEAQQMDGMVPEENIVI